ncbi:hypothetical protein ACFU7Y_27425 [Kitasatospora sp. NPDC057542]|uniref:hypothetical protein n=1 Tax=Kitasatospora sp. NPDC057542 TaxID=3346162 RepID=UPI00369F3D1B
MKITPRSALRAAAPLLTALLLAGCGIATQSPPSHDSALNKAAGIGTMSIVCASDMWDRTRPTSLSKVDKPPAEGERGSRGLVRVTLTGSQLVDYLKELDWNGHPGWGNEEGPDRAHHDEQIARRMYDVLAPAVANVKNARSAADAAPEVLVDDTLATAAP